MIPFTPFQTDSILFHIPNQIAYGVGIPDVWYDASTPVNPYVDDVLPKMDNLNPIGYDLTYAIDSAKSTPSFQNSLGGWIGAYNNTVPGNPIEYSNSATSSISKSSCTMVSVIKCVAGTGCIYSGIPATTIIRNYGIEIQFAPGNPAGTTYSYFWMKSNGSTGRIYNHTNKDLTAIAIWDGTKLTINGITASNVATSSVSYDYHTYFYNGEMDYSGNKDTSSAGSGKAGILEYLFYGWTMSSADISTLITQLKTKWGISY